MIFIKIYKDSSHFSKAEIIGHSGIKGESIPCAALSYLVQSIGSFLLLKNLIIYKDKKNKYIINLKLLKDHSNDIYEYLIFSFQLIARDYPDSIKIEYLEENNGS